MIQAREFSQEQRGVAWAMAGALVMTLLALGTAAVWDRAGVPVPFASRLQFAMRADLCVAAWLAAAIANVARLRFFSERDIAGSSTGSGSDEIRQAGAVLQNTFEQAGLAIAAHMVAASTFSRSNSLIGMMVGLFAVGRLFFWIGYKRGARGRAFGFALTFYPSLAALVAAAVIIAAGAAG